MSAYNIGAAPTFIDLEALVAYYQKQLKDEAYFYLQRRGIEPDTAEQFRIGYEAGRIGFYVPEGKLGGYFEHRVIVPITDASGQVVDLIGRSVDQREPKYKSLYGNDELLFNEQILAEADDVLVCGGVFDVLSLAQAKLPAVCVPVWMTFKESHAEKLKDKRVFICLGNDELGRYESARIAGLLEPLAKQVFVVTLPESIRDANDFFVRVQQPLDMFMRLLNDTMEQALMQPIAPDVKNITVYTEEYMKRYRGQVSGIATGLPKLDEALFGGLRSGLYLLAGAAASGKTMLMKQMADHIALEQTPVVYISWDMTAFELWARSIARIIGTEPQKVLSGREDPGVVNEANKQYIQISKQLWTIEGMPDTSIERVFASIERIAGLGGRTPVVFIDQMNRVPVSMAVPAQAPPAERQTALAYLLKQWSREWGGPVVAAVASDTDEERLPEGVEAAADVLMLLKPEGGEERDGVREVGLHIRKHRNGPNGCIPLRFRSATARFDGPETSLSAAGHRAPV